MFDSHHNNIVPRTISPELACLQLYGSRGAFRDYQRRYEAGQLPPGAPDPKKLWENQKRVHAAKRATVEALDRDRKVTAQERALLSQVFQDRRHGTPSPVVKTPLFYDFATGARIGGRV